MSAYMQVLASGKKVAFITGITGQTGSYLAEHLLQKGYVVFGMIRRLSTVNTPRINHIYPQLNLRYGDMTDGVSISTILAEIATLNPGRLEIYNLAAQSHVRVSFDIPAYTSNADYNGVVNLLEAVRGSSLYKVTRIYQASTSEMFGDSKKYPQNIDTPFNPQSPYAAAKVAAHHLFRIYRESYGMHLVSGISFNHDSPRRGETFATRKITIGVNRVLSGLQPKLTMGNIDSYRDITHARDIAEVIHASLQYHAPRDWVFASGETRSIREFIELAFAHHGEQIVWKGEGVNEKGFLKRSGQMVIDFDKKYYRPSEVNYLLGDPSEAMELLGWKRNFEFKDLVKEMMNADAC